MNPEKWKKFYHFDNSLPFQNSRAVEGEYEEETASVERDDSAKIILILIGDKNPG